MNAPRNQPRREMEWQELLHWLMSSGVRPGYPAGGGGKWKIAELAGKMGVSVTSVNNWKRGEKCSDVKKLAKKFAGSNQPELFEDIVYVHDVKFEEYDVLKSLTQVSTVHGIWDCLAAQCKMNHIRTTEIEASTIKDVAWLLETFDPTIDDAEGKARAARKMVYDAKYGDRTEGDDARHKIGIEKWNEEFHTLLKDIGVTPEKASLLCVGVGCGLEGLGIYDQFDRFTGIDISSNAVSLAVKAFPTAQGIFEGDAEVLQAAAKGFDVYVSLKTFQSSFFDISRAVEQCSLALNDNGLAIISVPRGYYHKDPKAETAFILKEGLARTIYNLRSAMSIGTYDVPDKLYPWQLTSKITKELYRRRFTDIQIKSGIHEHYIIARKA